MSFLRCFSLFLVAAVSTTAATLSGTGAWFGRCRHTERTHNCPLGF